MNDLTPPGTKLLAAIGHAMQVHAGQLRKGGNIPYVAHLLGVTSLVLEHGGDEEVAMAAMLHDAIEDVGVAQEAVINVRFGPRVAAIVRACTDADTQPKPPWRSRKEAYIAHLERVDQDALLVSCADKLHNVRAICADLRAHGLAVFGRFKGGRDGTMWYYATLANAFLRLRPGPLATELHEAVLVMNGLERELSGATQPGGFAE